ncbi:MAG TPA: DUF3368 domain-containing protein [Planctomycetaceae bacterium]|nr:DUF3368 domain-containing protein [Planctomycetaceae bacterium]
MTIVISDTSPIRSLAYLGELDLLRALYGDVIVPARVAAELRHGLSRPVVIVDDHDFLQVQSATNLDRLAEFESQVDPGEAEALTLMEELGADLLLIDERRGRALANALGMLVTGTVGLLVDAKRRGLIDNVGMRLRRLSDENGFRLSPQLLKTALKRRRRLIIRRIN